MQFINALSLAPDARDWLANSRHPRILHVFDHACNLINERRDVLSIVTPQIGNGPFSLVVEGDVLFSAYLHAQSLISIRANQLHLGDLSINTSDAKLWSPRPDWESLYAARNDILNQLASLPITNYQVRGLDTPFAKTAQGYSTTNSLQSPISNSLISSLAIPDITTAKILTSQLAGLGIGLTPSGDDFIMGAIYATWIIHPLETAKVLTEEIANTAAPLTTSLSAAWLRSAGRGEAGELWHELFDALVVGDEIEIQTTMSNILAVGETSGADALAGFFGVFASWAELTNSKIS